MIIKVDQNDIFDYVVGNTTIDPIERQIDFENRYEVFDDCIYDHLCRKIIGQKESFCKFSKTVSNLRKSANFMKREVVIKECEKLEAMEIDVTL